MRSALPDPFSTITSQAEETQTSTRYHYDNLRRGTSNEAVVQQTLSGEAFLRNAKETLTVGAGHGMLFTHDEPTSYGYPQDVTIPYELRYVSFHLAGLRGLFDRVRGEFGPVVRMSIEGEASALLVEIGRRFHQREFRDRFQETELLHQLLVALYREQVAAAETRDPIEFGQHLLRNNFRSPLNLKQVAARCGVSREHFIREFGRRYGEPPGQLLRKLRLQQAQRMLRATRLPVQEVALACGFADSKSFCRAFRVHFGVSPSATRT